MKNASSHTICFEAYRNERSPLSPQERLTQKERRQLILGRHRSLMGLFNYHEKLEPISSDKSLKLLKQEATLNKNLSALLYRGAVGEDSALSDLKQLDLESLGLDGPSLFQEIFLLDEGAEKIQGIMHRVSLYSRDFKTAEANEMRQSLHDYKIGGQVLAQAIEELNLEKNVVKAEFS